MNRNDWKLVILLLIAGSIGMISVWVNASEGNRVVVKVGGEVTASYSINENREVTIEGQGGYNVLVIEDGSVYLKEADCSNQTCVEQGAIRKTGESIVCLPHEVVVTIEVKNAEDSEEKEVDVIAK